MVDAGGKESDKAGSDDRRWSVAGHAAAWGLGIMLHALPALALEQATIEAGLETDIRQFVHYDIESGLPQSQVYSLGRDDRGYLWVGTLAGLARYNGREFARLTTADGLTGNQIEVIATAADGQVWAGGAEGVCRLGPDPHSTACIPPPPEGVQTVNALAANAHDVWVGTNNGLLRADSATLELTDSHLAEQAVTALHSSDRGLWAGTDTGRLVLQAAGETSPTVELQLPKEARITTILDTGELLWLGTGQGLWLADGNGGFVNLSSSDSGLPSSTVTGLVRLNDDELLVSTLRGLYRVVRKSGPNPAFTVFRVQGLASEVIRSMLLDREGLVWLGLDTGLARMVPTRFDAFDTRSGMHADFVRAIAQDDQQRLWLGTRTGLQVVPLRNGLPRFDQAHSVTAAEGLPNDRIYSILLIGRDEALLATNSGMVHWHLDEGLKGHWTSADGLPANQVRAIRRVADGTLWVSTEQGVVTFSEGQFRHLDPPLLNDMYAINFRIDDHGRKWFATVGHGLVILQPDGSLDRVDTRVKSADRAVWDLWPAADGSGMWAGTNGDGLIKVDPQGNIKLRLNTHEGLADDFVWSVLVDSSGAVWAYSTHGLNRLDAQGITSFGRADGLLHLEGIATAVLEDADGDLWFGSVGGLMRYQPSRELPPSEPPRTVIEHAKVDGRILSLGQVLEPNFDSIDFDYATLAFRDERALRYRHRLVGLSENWSEPLAWRPVSYARLPAGNYRFEVTGADATGRWSEQPAIFKFSVAQPWWRQGWVLLLAVLAASLLVILAVRFRERRLRAHANSLEELVRVRTEDLELANRRLKEAATSDPLTGLKNRRFLTEQIEHDIAWLERLHREPNGDDSAVLMFLLIDLDNFKAVNDRLGHQAGDEVLAAVSEVLCAQVRHADYVVRWGGDEFLVVARGAETDEGMRLGARIRTALGEARFEIGSGQVVEGIGCSIGLSGYPFDPDRRVDWAKAIEIADVAVYRIKRNGGGGCMMILASEQISIADGDNFVFDLRQEFNDYLSADLIRIVADDEDGIP